MRITLQQWSKKYFCRPRKSRTLYGYIEKGKIYPAPVKVGREYEVEPYAVLLDRDKKFSTCSKGAG